MGELRESPKTREAFLDRYNANNVVERAGTLEQITHMPCMFCGAPDLILIRALHAQEDLERGARCQECGRGIRVVFRDEGNMVQYEVFQTEGVDPPEYIMPWPRRVS